MSPAITDGERFAGLSRLPNSSIRYLEFLFNWSSNWSCARDFLCSVVALPVFLSYREQNIARSRAPQQLRVQATLGSCNECGARRALAYSAN